jgi:hypothetical protein
MKSKKYQRMFAGLLGPTRPPVLLADRSTSLISVSSFTNAPFGPALDNADGPDTDKPPASGLGFFADSYSSAPSATSYNASAIADSRSTANPTSSLSNSSGSHPTSTLAAGTGLALQADFRKSLAETDGCVMTLTGLTKTLGGTDHAVRETASDYKRAENAALPVVTTGGSLRTFSTTKASKTIEAAAGLARSEATCDDIPGTM